MRLELSEEQHAALLNADFLPDNLRARLDAASQDGGKRIVELSGDEATATEELCSWNVKTDENGDVKPESKVFDEIVTAIVSHPDY